MVLRSRHGFDTPVVGGKRSIGAHDDGGGMGLVLKCQEGCVGKEDIRSKDEFAAFCLLFRPRVRHRILGDKIASADRRSNCVVEARLREDA